MFGLGNQIGGDEIGVSGFVGHDDHFARSGDRIDIDFAKHMPLGQRNEQIAGADDLVDLRHAFDAVSQCRHRLCTADSINFGNAQFVAGGQQVVVVRPKLRRRRDDGQFPSLPPPEPARRSSAPWKDMPPLRRARKCRLGPAANSAAADIRPRRDLHRNIVLQNSLLKAENVFPNSADACEKFGFGRGVGRRQLRGTHSNRLGRQFRLIDPGSIIQNRRQAFGPHIVANSLDHLLRR